MIVVLFIRFDPDCSSMKYNVVHPWLRAVFPLRPYVAKLAQHFEKLAQQILCEWVKKMLLLYHLANFQPKLVILAQESLQFYQIW